MKNKKVVSEETIENTTEAVEGAAPAKAKKDRKELHDIFFAIGLILGAIGIVFVFFAQSGVNNDGYLVLQFFKTLDIENPNLQFLQKPIEVEFLTITLSSIIAGVLGVLSTGCGLARNFLKRDKKVTSYIVGVIVIVLAVIAYLAGVYAEV